MDMAKVSPDNQAMSLHRQLQGKVGINTKAKLTNLTELSLLYTPGVGAVATYLSRHPEQTHHYTGTHNSVAVVSDGSAVLGLGNIGPAGALPVMEGKTLIFKAFADIDAYPIVLATQEPEQIIAAVRAIAPSFGAINLEDIAAPACFSIEASLKEELNIPVVHDDQHGTAIVVLAGLINAFKVVSKSIHNARIAVIGAGPAGVAVTKLLYEYRIGDIVVVDSQGIIHHGRRDLPAYKEELAHLTNREHLQGDLKTALASKDAVIGVSRAGLIKPAWIKTMANQPIVFALANPIPEIMPTAAARAGAAVIATGRSDFANQINNALAFPGLFRGALDHHVRHLDNGHKIKAAEALAAVVKKPGPNKIIPNIFDKTIVKAIASAIH